jgi:hypothetical protein
MNAEKRSQLKGLKNMEGRQGFACLTTVRIPFFHRAGIRDFTPDAFEIALL